MLLPLLRAALAILQFSLGSLTLPLGILLFGLQGSPRLLSLSLSLTLLVLQLALGLLALPLALHLIFLRGPLRPLALSLSLTLLGLQLALVLAVLGRWFRCVGRPRRPLVRSVGHRGGIIVVGVLLGGLHQHGPSGSMWTWSAFSGRRPGDSQPRARRHAIGAHVIVSLDAFDLERSLMAPGLARGSRTRCPRPDDLLAGVRNPFFWIGRTGRLGDPAPPPYPGR